MGGIAALRAELHDQWQTNHFGRCGRDWPHPAGEDCYWPRPDILGPVDSGSISPAHAFDKDASCALAIEALASLVRDEYPDDLSLAEIARRWGHDLTPDHLAALAEIELGGRPEVPLGVPQAYG